MVLIRKNFILTLLSPLVKWTQYKTQGFPEVEILSVQNVFSASLYWNYWFYATLPIRNHGDETDDKDDPCTAYMLAPNSHR
jgi:hypothetical protein